MYLGRCLQLLTLNAKEVQDIITTPTLGSLLYLFKGDPGFIQCLNITILIVEARGMLQPPEIKLSPEAEQSPFCLSDSVLEMGPVGICGNSALRVCFWCLTWHS